MKKQNYSLVKMKFRIILVAALLAIGFSESFGQSLSEYLREQGSQLMGFFAHPTNTFKSANFNIYSDNIWMNIHYEDGYYTELRLGRTGNFFTSISVIEDNDFVRPFIAIEASKDLILKSISESDSDQALSDFENFIGRKFDEMSGRDLACLIFTVGWLSYQ